MRSLLAFFKKELTEQLRSSRMTVLLIVFVLLGIMNPATAKLTPWLLEVMSESLAESGMTVTVIEVSALDSWMQFFKNVPMGLIAFVLMQSAIFTKEYQSGTLVLSLTKGLARHWVVLSKSMVLTVLWSAFYWLHFGITYAYTVYFWDPSIVQNLAFSTTAYWLFGVWVIALTVLFSTLASANTGVLLGTGGVVLASVLVGMLPKVEKYLPTKLMDGISLIYGMLGVEAYLPALIITALTSVALFAVAIPVFRKKQL